MIEGLAGYPFGTMTPRISSTSATNADFVCVDTADARTVAWLRRELSQWLRAYVMLEGDKLNDVVLAVNEALTNAAEFAYRGRQPGTMTLQVRFDRADGTLIAEVSDNGTWRHVDPSAQPNTRGRGIPLMRALADSITISQLPDGTHVVMRFDEARAPAAAFAFV